MIIYNHVNTLTDLCFMFWKKMISVCLEDQVNPCYKGAVEAIHYMDLSQWNFFIRALD